ncbi:MAG: DUF2341 domain-containing protein, partial [Candidatus Gracilibacteria bacterium]|nr:DUF2341 domain-containing protein [Candidatus Gracilibacteria bacterium]
MTGLTTVSGTGTYLTPTAAQIFNGGLTISGGTYTGSTGALAVYGVMTFSSGALTAPSGLFLVNGNWNRTGGTFTPGTGTVIFDGAVFTTQTLNNVGSAFYSVSHAGAGTLALVSDLALANGGTLTQSAGIFDTETNSKAVTVGSSGTTSTLAITGGTWEGDGGTGANQNIVVWGPMSVSNATFKKSSNTLTAKTTLTAGLNSGSGTTTFTSGSGNIDVDSHFTIQKGVSETVSFTAPSGTLFVGGNWGKTAGTFNHNNGTVTFDGATPQSITGANTFYSFTKSVTTAATLTFPEGLTQAFVAGGTLTLNGAAGNLLSIRSSSLLGVQASINPQGTRSISYVDVQDNNNIHATAINPANSVDAGNTTNWFTDRISGRLYAADGTTPLTGKLVQLWVNGSATGGGNDTTDGSGDYLITGTSFTSGDVLTLFISGAAEDGVTVTISNAVILSGIDIYQNHLIVRDEDGVGGISNSDLEDSNGSFGSADLDSIYTTPGPLVLCEEPPCPVTIIVNSGKTLLVPSGHIFAPRDQLVVEGSTDIKGTLTLPSIGKGVVYSLFSGSFAISSGAVVNGGGFPMTFDGAISSAGTFTTTTDTMTVNGDFTRTAGTFTNSGSLTFAGTGTSTLSVNGVSVGSISVDGTSKTLQLGSAATVTTLVIGADDTVKTAGNILTATTHNIANGGVLEVRSGTDFTVTTPDTNSGKIRYVGNGNDTANNMSIRDSGATDYYNLEILSTDVSPTPDNFRLSLPLSVAGTFTISAGTFNANDQPVTSTGLVTVQGTSGAIYNAGGATQTFNGGLTVTRALFQGGAGIIDVTNVSISDESPLPPGDFHVSGNWVFDDTNGVLCVPSCGAKLTFDGSGTQTIAVPSERINELTHSGSGTLQALSALTILDSLAVSSGVLDLNGQNLTATGAIFSNTATVRDTLAGTILGLAQDPYSGTWLVAAAGSLRDLGATDYFDLDINPTSGTVSSSGTIVTTGDIDAQTGTFGGTADITVGGGDIGGAGVINMTGGKVTLPGSTLGGTGGPYTFNDVDLTGTGTTTAQGTITVNGALTVGDGTAHTLDLTTNDAILAVNNLTVAALGVVSASDTQPLTIFGNYTNNGSLTHNNGMVVFTSPTTDTILDAGQTYYDVTMNASGTYLLGDFFRVNHLATISQNTRIHATSGSYGIRFDGSVDIADSVNLSLEPTGDITITSGLDKIYSTGGKAGTLTIGEGAGGTVGFGTAATGVLQISTTIRDAITSGEITTLKVTGGTVDLNAIDFSSRVFNLTIDAGNIGLEQLTLATDQTLRLISTGTITDDNGSTNNVTIAGTGSVLFDAVTNVGTALAGDEIETSVQNLAARTVSGYGSIYVAEADDLVVGSVGGINGVSCVHSGLPAINACSVQANGGITLNQAISGTDIPIVLIADADNSGAGSLSGSGTLTTTTSGDISVRSSGVTSLGAITSVGGLTLDAGTTAPTYTAGGAISATTLTIAANVILDLNGRSLAMTTLVNNGALKLWGNESVTGGAAGDGEWVFRGDGVTNPMTLPNLTYETLTINDPTATTTFQPTATLNVGTLEITQGTFYQNGQTVTVTNPTTFILNGGTYNQSGTLNVSGDMDIQEGTFNGSSDPINITRDFIQGVTGTGGTFHSTSGTMTVGRNFNHPQGTFDANGGTVDFDTATTAVISGNTTWNNLSSVEAGGKSIQVATGSTQTINGALTLTGASGNVIALASNSAGVQWTIDHQGTESLSYVSVKDSACTVMPLSTAIDATDNGYDLGNNGVCWVFETLQLGEGPGFIPQTQLTTAQDLYSDVVGIDSGEIGAYWWTVGASNLMALNMPFNAGGTQTDFSGNGNTGTTYNMTTPNGYVSSGKVGGAMSFDGVNDYVSRSDDSDFDISSALSVSVWVNPASYDATNRFIVTKGNGAVAYNYTLFLRNTVGDVQFTGASSSRWDSPPTANQWNHIVIVADSTNSYAYLNGVKLTCTSGYTCGGLGSVNNDPLYIGYNGYSDNYFKGSLDEVQIYPRALSAAQVAQLCNDGDSDGDCSDGIDVGQGFGGPTLWSALETSVDNVWSLSVTPITSSGIVGSTVVSANTVEILPYAPITDLYLEDGVVTTLSTVEDLNALDPVPGLAGTDIGAYTWSVDPDAGDNPAENGTSPSANLMALNMPFHYGTTQTDFSGNSLNGTTVAVDYISGGSCKVGGCLRFDSVADVVGFGDPQIMEDVISGEDKKFSMSFWIKPSAVMTNNFIIAKAADSSCSQNQRSYLLRLGTGSKPEFLWYGALDGTSYRGVLGSTSVTNTSIWYHVVMTYDGTIDTNNGLDRVKIFVNNLLETTTLNLSFGSLLGAANGTAHFALGNMLTPSGSICGVGIPSFNGSIDEVQIYPRALSAAQISQLYTNGNAGNGGPTLWSALETSVDNVWNLSVTPITSSGVVGSTVVSANTVEIIPYAPITALQLGIDNGGFQQSTTATTVQDIWSNPTGLSLPDIGVYRWTVGASNLMALNMPFNEGGTQTDFSGNGNTGTATNMVSPNGYVSSGRVGGAMSFDGVNDYINVPHSAVNNFGKTDAFTGSAWVNVTDFATLRYIFAKQRVTSPYEGYDLQVATSGKIWVEMVDTAIKTKRIESNVALSTGTWQHVAFTYNGSGDASGVKIYINGVNIAVTVLYNDAFTADIKNTLPLLIGARDTVYQPMKGLIDEVQIYPRALSAAQISRLYTDGVAGFGAPTVLANAETFNGDVFNLIITPLANNGISGTAVTSANTVTIAPDVYLEDGLVEELNTLEVLNSTVDTLDPGSVGAYRWTTNGANVMALNMPFNSGATQTDFSGNGNTGTVTGAVYQSCQVGGCLNFNGTTNYVQTPSNSTLNMSGELTISAWVNLTAGGGRGIFEKTVGGVLNTDYSLFLSGTSTYFRIHNGTSYTDLIYAAQPSTGAWHHILAVNSVSGGYRKIYIDGVQVASGASSAMRTGGDGLSYIGRLATTGYYFSGKIDELQVYPRALSVAEIIQLCDDGDGDAANGTCNPPSGGAIGAGVGGPTAWVAAETVPEQLWGLTVTPISSAGVVGSTTASSNQILILGPDISGTCVDSYGGASCSTSYTVKVAVNGVLQAGKTTTDSDGSWTIPGVTASSGNVITVFLDGAEDSAEAVAVAKYLGAGEAMTGLELVRTHLTLGNGVSQTLSNAEVGSYINSADEDAFHGLDGSALTVNGDGGLTGRTLTILTGTTYQPGGVVNSGNIIVESGASFLSGANNVTASGSGDLTIAGVYTATGSSTINVDGSLILEATGALTLASNLLQVAVNWTNNGGGFTAGTSTVDFDTLGTSQIRGDNTFNNFKSEVASKALRFEENKTQTIGGVLALSGLATGTELSLDLIDGTLPWSFAVTAADQHVSYVSVSNANAMSHDIYAADSISGTGNDDADVPPTDQWIFSSMAISGTVYTNDPEASGTVISGKTVVVAVFDGSGTLVGTQTAETNMFGDYAIAVIPAWLLSGYRVTIFLDGETEKAVTVLKVNGVSVVDADLYVDHLVVRDETGTSITNADLDVAHDVADSDVDAIYMVDATVPTIQSGKELYIPSASTFAPGGNVNTHHIQNKGTLTAGANTITVGGNWINTGIFTAGTGTVTFTSTTAQTIDSTGATTSDFSTIAFNGVGGEWTMNSALTATTMDLLNGTAIMNSKNLSLTTLNNNGTLKLVGDETVAITMMDTDTGTVEYYGGGTYGALGAGNAYYDLSFTGTGSYDLSGALDVNGDLSLTGGGGAWYSGYSYRKSVTIDRTKVAATQSNFPILFSVTDLELKTVANGGYVTHANGYDIIFTDSSGNKLDHEIEKYVSTTGEFVAWVRIPTLSSIVDTSIYLFYGNGSVSTNPSVSGTWDSNFKGVYHMPNGTTLSVTDSTSNGYNGTNTAVTATTGQVDGAGNFNGTTAYV